MGDKERCLDEEERCQALLDEARQQFASVVWTHKVQEKQADIYTKRYERIETVNILAAALTSCGIITSIFVDALFAKVLTAVLSFVTLGIASYYKSFGIKERAMENKAAANRFIVIRNELLQIITDLHMMLEPADEINGRFKDVMDRLNKLYVDAPSASEAAVKKASEALNGGAEYTYSDEEIDRFLPPSLRGPVASSGEPR